MIKKNNNKFFLCSGAEDERNEYLCYVGLGQTWYKRWRAAVNNQWTLDRSGIYEVEKARKKRMSYFSATCMPRLLQRPLKLALQNLKMKPWLE